MNSLFKKGDLFKNFGNQPTRIRLLLRRDRRRQVPTWKTIDIISNDRLSLSEEYLERAYEQIT